MPGSFVWLHQTAKFLACVPWCAEHSRGTQQLSRGGGEEAANKKTKPSSRTKSKAGDPVLFPGCSPHIPRISAFIGPSLGQEAFLLVDLHHKHPALSNTGSDEHTGKLTT